MFTITISLDDISLATGIAETLSTFPVEFHLCMTPVAQAESAPTKSKTPAPCSRTKRRATVALYA